MAFRNIKKRIFLLISTLLISSVFIQSASAEPRISKAVFAESVKNHKPINQLDTLSDDLDKLYFFTDIRGYQGHTLTHQWTYGDWVVQSLPFTIKGHRWRVSSSKTLDKKMKGKWTVKIVDENGTTLQENSIAYSGSASQIIPKDKVTTNTAPKQNKAEEKQHEDKPKRNKKVAEAKDQTVDNKKEEKPKEIEESKDQAADNKKEEQPKEVEEKQREDTSRVDKTNNDKEVESKEVTQKTTETNTNKVEDKKEVKPEEITQKKTEKVEEQVDSSNHSDSANKTQASSKNNDDGDEEDCEPDEVETSTPSNNEDEALLTDDDFELKADTKQDDAVAKMAKTVIEQLEKIPAEKTE